MSMYDASNLQIRRQAVRGLWQNYMPQWKRGSNRLLSLLRLVWEEVAYAPLKIWRKTYQRIVDMDSNVGVDEAQVMTIVRLIGLPLWVLLWSFELLRSTWNHVRFLVFALFLVTLGWMSYCTFNVTPPADEQGGVV